MSAGETALHLKGDGSSIALDVEEVHRIFKLGDIHVAAFVDGLSATADNGRVSWVAFLRYMCDLADVRLLRAGRRQAVSVAGKIFNLFDEQKHHEVELRVLASGLSVRGRLGVAGLAADTTVHLRNMYQVCSKETHRAWADTVVQTVFLRCSPIYRCSAKGHGRIGRHACSASLIRRTGGRSHEKTCKFTASRRSRQVKGVNSNALCYLQGQDTFAQLDLIRLRTDIRTYCMFDSSCVLRRRESGVRRAPTLGQIWRYRKRFDLNQTRTTVSRDASTSSCSAPCIRRCTGDGTATWWAAAGMAALKCSYRWVWRTRCTTDPRRTPRMKQRVTPILA